MGGLEDGESHRPSLSQLQAGRSMQPNIFLWSHRTLYPQSPSSRKRKQSRTLEGWVDAGPRDRIVRNVCVDREKSVSGSPVYLLSGVSKHCFIGQWLHQQ